jgi:hypothetical protein
LCYDISEVSGVSNKKFQITKNKYQTNHNDPISKFQTIGYPEGSLFQPGFTPLTSYNDPSGLRYHPEQLQGC